MSSKSNPQKRLGRERRNPKSGERTVGVYDRPERKWFPVNPVALIVIGLILVAILVYFLIT